LVVGAAPAYLPEDLTFALCEGRDGFLIFEERTLLLGAVEDGLQALHGLEEAGDGFPLGVTKGR